MRLHNMSSMILAAALLLSTAGVAQADVLHMTGSQTSLETVWVMDKNNTADNGYGAVGYNYLMGKYEVTNAQYCQFLNAKAATTDTYALYSASMSGISRSGNSGNYSYAVNQNYDNRPVNYVSWCDGIRFANWLQNGQGNGSTETGTYSITGGGANNGTVAIPSLTTRATWAENDKHWALPTENEWYKAAYYDPNKSGGAGYYLYPTGATATATAGDTTNGHAVFHNQAAPANVNNAGGLSAYGTMGQGGNVAEWNEAVGDESTERRFRGGAYSSANSTPLGSSAYSYKLYSLESSDVGIRLVLVPEPASLVMLAGIALTALLYWLRKRA